MIGKTTTERARVISMLVIGIILILTGYMSTNGYAESALESIQEIKHESSLQDYVSHVLSQLLKVPLAPGLSFDQITTIRTIVANHEKNRIRQEVEIKVTEVDFKMLVYDDKDQISAIEQSIKKSESARASLLVDGAEALRDAIKVLNPEQRKQWRESLSAKNSDEKCRARCGDGTQPRLGTEPRNRGSGVRQSVPPTSTTPAGTAQPTN